MNLNHSLIISILSVLAIAGCSDLATNTERSRPTDFSLGDEMTSNGNAATNRHIICFDGVVTANDRQFLRDAHIEVVEELPLIDGLVVRFPASSLQGPQGLVERYSRTLLVEPDFLVQPSLSPNDPLLTQQWGLHNTGTDGVADADIDALETWDITQGSESIVVGVLDSGVDVSHPDLTSNMWKNPDEILDGVDNDNNGLIDDIFGFDFFNNDGTVYDGPHDYHGTHVAGIAAATGNNGIGVSGVSWRAQIMALKFIGPAGGWISDAIRGLEYAKSKNLKLVNASFGTSGHSEAFHLAIERSGVLLIAAAGNSGIDIDDQPRYPASFDLERVVSVGSSDRSDRRSSFSNFGRQSVDLFAPGTGIESTLPDGAYGQLSGTSMAAPFVTGTAALLLAEDPNATLGTLREKLLDTVDERPMLQGLCATDGRLNAAAAVGANPEPPNVPPVADAGPNVDVTDRDGNGRQRIHLDGSGSVDPDGSIVSWIWRVGSVVILSHESGNVSLEVGTHTVTLTVTDDGGESHRDEVVCTVHPRPPVRERLFRAGFEVDRLNASKWRTGDSDSRRGRDYWGLSTERRSSGSKSLYCAAITSRADGNYSNFMRSHASLLREIDLSGHRDVTIKFRLWHRIRAEDRLYLQTRSGGGGWVSVREWTQSSDGWKTVEVPVTGSTLRFRFLFVSSRRDVRKGAFVDDIEVWGTTR